MKISEILLYIFLEMKEAINENRKERVLELGTAVDILYEIAKNKDKQVEDILHKLDYVVFHYEDESSFADDYMGEIQQLIIELENR
jgi:hypothetical protein